MPVKAPAPPPPVSNWTGFYIGGNSGFGWTADANVSINPLDPATAFVTPSGHQIVDPASMSLTTGGWLTGVQLGYNWQFDRNWVAGIEADYDWADINGSGSTGVNMAGFGPNFGTLNASPKVDWFGTVRARLGFLVGSTLLYATGGLARGKVDHSANLEVSNFNLKWSKLPFVGLACVSTIR